MKKKKNLSTYKFFRVLFVVCLCVYGWGPIGDQYLVRRLARPAFACIELGLACPPSDTALTACLSVYLA